MLSIEKVISATRAKLFGIVASTQGARSARFFFVAKHLPGWAGLAPAYPAKHLQAGMAEPEHL